MNERHDRFRNGSRIGGAPVLAAAVVTVAAAVITVAVDGWGAFQKFLVGGGDFCHG